MRYILAQRNARVLARFARSNVLVTLDYDGTLAPIVADPAAATMRRRTRRLLERLTQRYTCAVLSGRSHSKLLRFLGGVAIRWIVGNDGAVQRNTGVFKQRVRRWKARITPSLAQLPGVVV